jgi:hypothetical protein
MKENQKSTKSDPKKDKTKEEKEKDKKTKKEELVRKIIYNILILTYYYSQKKI